MQGQSTINYDRSTYKNNMLETVARAQKKRWAEKNARKPMNEVRQTHMQPGHARKRCVAPEE